MNSVQREMKTRAFLDDVELTLNRKGNDYASTDDAFSNFTNTANVLKIPVEKVFLSEIVKKVSRITELLGKEAKCESVYDSIRDIAGYACLLDNYMRGIDEEKRNQAVGLSMGQVNQTESGV